MTCISHLETSTQCRFLVMYGRDDLVLVPEGYKPLMYGLSSHSVMLHLLTQRAKIPLTQLPRRHKPVPPASYSTQSQCADGYCTSPMPIDMTCCHVTDMQCIMSQSYLLSRHYDVTLPSVLTVSNPTGQPTRTTLGTAPGSADRGSCARSYFT